MTTMIAKDAELIRSNDFGLELRLATDPSQTWPGYHMTCPLGRKGYWWGNHRKHEYLGTGEKDALAEWDYLQL